VALLAYHTSPGGPLHFDQIRSLGFGLLTPGIPVLVALPRDYRSSPAMGICVGFAATVVLLWAATWLGGRGRAARIGAVAFVFITSACGAFILYGTLRA
jgi:hypothetical protein